MTYSVAIRPDVRVRLGPYEVAVEDFSVGRETEQRRDEPDVGFGDSVAAEKLASVAEPVLEPVEGVEDVIDRGVVIRLEPVR